MLRLSQAPNSRHVAKPAGEPAGDVLARHTCHCPALHHPLLLQLFRNDTRRGLGHSRPSESVHASLHRHLRISVPPLLTLSHFDIDRHAVFDQQGILVDAGHGVGVLRFGSVQLQLGLEQHW